MCVTPALACAGSERPPRARALPAHSLATEDPHCSVARRKAPYWKVWPIECSVRTGEGRRRCLLLAGCCRSASISACCCAVRRSGRSASARCSVSCGADEVSWSWSARTKPANHFKASASADSRSARRLGTLLCSKRPDRRVANKRGRPCWKTCMQTFQFPRCLRNIILAHERWKDESHTAPSRSRRIQYLRSAR